MAAINIRRDVEDSYYRYKMPRIQSKIEGKGNGIKTVIPNLAEISRSLGRQPAYVHKYFGIELGAQTSVGDLDRHIVNGAHDAGKLQDTLDGFINKFVLCSSCKNPETDIVVTKDGGVYRDCKACGTRSTVDLRHKLTSVIVKNPPTKIAQKNKKEKTKPNGSAGDENHANDGEDELTRRIKAEAAEIPDAREHDQDDDWAVDTSASAQASRVQELEANIKKTLVLGDDDEFEDDNNADSPYDQFGVWIEEAKSPSDVELYKKAQELGISAKHRTLQVLTQTLFDENIIKQIASRVGLLRKLVISEKHEKSLLGGIERMIGAKYTQLIPQVPKILMTLYQEDLISEPVVIKWGSRASRKYCDKDMSRKIRVAATPFLKWLSEAESDDDEEDNK